MDRTCNGVLGGLTFGMFHNYISMKQIQLNNKNIETQRQQFLDKMKIQLKNNECLYKEIYESIKK